MKPPPWKVARAWCIVAALATLGTALAFGTAASRSAAVESPKAPFFATLAVWGLAYGTVVTLALGLIAAILWRPSAPPASPPQS